MSKKDFTMLAAVIANLQESTTRVDVAHAIAVEVMNTNRHFDMVRFLTACGCKATRVGAN